MQYWTTSLEVCSAIKGEPRTNNSRSQKVRWCGLYLPLGGHREGSLALDPAGLVDPSVTLVVLLALVLPQHQNEKRRD